jgi:hypothetical protein
VKNGRNPSRFFRGASETKWQAVIGTVWRPNSLIIQTKMAHPARFELTTSAFGGKRLKGCEIGGVVRTCFDAGFLRA